MRKDEEVQKIIVYFYEKDTEVISMPKGLTSKEINKNLVHEYGDEWIQFSYVRDIEINTRHLTHSAQKLAGLRGEKPLVSCIFYASLLHRIKSE